MANYTFQSLAGFLHDEEGLWGVYLKVFSGVAGCLRSNSRILFRIRTLHRGNEIDLPLHAADDCLNLECFGSYQLASKVYPHKNSFPKDSQQSCLVAFLALPGPRTLLP